MGGHALLHSDRDFDLFEQHLGLTVIHPPEPRILRHQFFGSTPIIGSAPLETRWE
jgi:hypothetical protein